MLIVNYIKVFVRSLKKEWLVAAINLSSLTLGISCVLAIMLYLNQQWSYDKHNERHEQVFRVARTLTTDGGTKVAAAATPAPLGFLLKRDYPEVLDYARFRPIQRAVLKLDQDVFYEDAVMYADNSAFRLFSHDILKGDEKTALAGSNSIVLSESMALRYFGDEDPIGKTIEHDDTSYRVTAVFADFPENTHMRYSALLSHPQDRMSSSEMMSGLWRLSEYTYVLMPPNFDVSAFERISEDFFSRYMQSAASQAGATVSFHLEPLARIHFYSDLQYDLPTGNMNYVIAFFIIGVFLIAIACINYVNLATARSSNRSKEVAMRKILGARKGQLTAQYTGEATAYALLGFIISVGIVKIASNQNILSELLGSGIEFALVEDIGIVLFSLALSLVVGVIAGFYPALYLSGISPIIALKQTLVTKAQKLFRLRHVLVFVQFAVALTVVISTWMMSNQMNYVLNKPLGFDKDNLIVVTVPKNYPSSTLDSLKQRYGAINGVLNVASASSVPGDYVSYNFMEVESNTGEFETQTINRVSVDEDYLATMGINVVVGEGFNDKVLSQSRNSIVVNQAVVELMGWSDPTGKRIRVPGLGEKAVIGVVEDFHYDSLHKKVAPLILLWSDEQTNYVLARFESGSFENVIARLDAIWRETSNAQPFEYTLLSDSMRDLYEEDMRLMRLIGTFAVICIFISLIGLFGVSIFVTEQRTKEIAIRKLLGEQTAEIIARLFKTFLIMIVIASLVASFAAYFLVEKWRSTFEFHAELDVMVFPVVALAAVVLALLTIAAQTYKIVNGNAVVALKHR